MKKEGYNFMKLIEILSKNIRKSSGQVMAIFALALPVFIGMGVLAVDVGHLYVSRNVLQNAADAGAKAGAIVLANSNGDQSAATAEATTYTNRNIATYNPLAGTTTTVTFPSASTVRVTVAHNVPLFLGPVIGFNNGNVTATALASFGLTSTVPPGNLVPLGIVCNTPGTGPGADNCYNQMPVGQEFTERRYCGNYFMKGPSGNSCGNDIQEGEKFLMGIDFNRDIGTSVFREHFYSGFPDPVSWGDTAMAIPGNSNGWKTGVRARLDEGRNIMVMPVLKAHGDPTHDYNTQVHGFIAVEVKYFGKKGNTDQITYKVIKKYFSDAEYEEDGSGGIGTTSVGAISLIE